MSAVVSECWRVQLATLSLFGWVGYRDAPAGEVASVVVTRAHGCEQSLSCRCTVCTIWSAGSEAMASEKDVTPRGRWAMRGLSLCLCTAGPGACVLLF